MIRRMVRIFAMAWHYKCVVCGYQVSTSVWLDSDKKICPLCGKRLQTLGEW